MIGGTSTSELENPYRIYRWGAVELEAWKGPRARYYRGGDPNEDNSWTGLHPETLGSGIVELDYYAAQDLLKRLQEQTEFQLGICGGSWGYFPAKPLEEKKVK